MGGRLGEFRRLTALQAQCLRKPGKYPDGGGLYLLVHAGGSRSWAFLYPLIRELLPRHSLLPAPLVVVSLLSRGELHRDAM